MMEINASRGSSGFEECIGVTHFLMKVVGVWPLGEHRNLLRRCHFVLPASLIFFFIVIPQTRRAIFEYHNLNLMIEVLTTADIIEAIALIKLLGLWYNKKDLKILVIQIHKDWITRNAQEQVMMWANARIGRFIALFCIISTCGSVVFHSIVYLITIHSLVSQGNASMMKPLYLKSHFPFDTHYSPVYEIVCFCQFLGASLSTFAFSSFDSLFVCSILHFTAQLYNLKRRVKNIVREHVIKKVKFSQILKSVIHEHQHLVRYVNILENSFNKIFLVQILWTSVALCLQGYQLVMIITESGTKLLANLIFIVTYIISILVSIFFYCYVAELMRTESQSLCYAVYDTQWYDLLPKNSRLLLILMNRYRWPIEITVGKFAVFSLGYFANIVKTSVGYLSVLLAIKNKMD